MTQQVAPLANQDVRAGDTCWAPARVSTYVSRGACGRTAAPPPASGCLRPVAWAQRRLNVCLMWAARARGSTKLGKRRGAGGTRPHGSASSPAPAPATSIACASSCGTQGTCTVVTTVRLSPSPSAPEPVTVAPGAPPGPLTPGALPDPAPRPDSRAAAAKASMLISAGRWSGGVS